MQLIFFSRTELKVLRDKKCISSKYRTFLELKPQGVRLLIISTSALRQQMPTAVVFILFYFILYVINSCLND